MIAGMLGVASDRLGVRPPRRAPGWIRVRTAPGGGPGATVFDELMATGAVITGRRTFDNAGGWAGDHHDGALDGPGAQHLRYRGRSGR